MSDALGILGIRTAHLGKIYQEPGNEHNNPKRLIRIHEQLAEGDDRLDILDICDGLADYPVCCLPIIKRVDQAYPGSLFINVLRSTDMNKWLQSVERQFVGLQLLKQGANSTPLERAFMEVMLSFRSMTFGDAKFCPERYARVYASYQQDVNAYFSGRTGDLLTLDLEELEEVGFERLSEFLQCPAPEGKRFPRSNAHSTLPTRAFFTALQRGEISSLTGLSP